jgi:hypothetical protein
MLARAPIVLFVYRRPEHTERALAALAACRESAESPLYVYSDGPREDAAAAGVRAVREIVRQARGFASVRVVERESNWGLARSVIDGVGEVMAAHGRAIVVEDDLEVSPAFLCFMNTALAMYEDHHLVASIHGYRYPTTARLPETFFLRGADCWGWGTWARAWKKFSEDAHGLEKRLQECPWRSEFDFDGAYPYWRMLRESANGKVDSWAIRWHASAFVEGMYTLYPGESLVRNLGHDGSGTHGNVTKDYETDLALTAPRLDLQEPATNRAAYVAFRTYFLSLRPSLAARIAGRLFG